MAYTPTQWVTGDKVTSAKLNKIENGIADKVDKVSGKALSTNDYTNADKKKVDDISISSPTNGQALVYNSSTQKWENKTISSGESGQDGYSPTITVTNITGGHRVSITDVNGTKTFDVMDGSGGSSITIDPTLTIEGVAADAKATGEEISGLEERVDALEQGGGGSGTGGSGLTSEAKAALLACFRGVTWHSDVNPVALYSALDIALNPPANLLSISAVYTQSGSVDIMDSLDSLRNDLVVTAHYSDGTSGVVTGYVLSGSLAEVGTSTITVSYGGKTTTFTVTVISEWTYIWDLTNSLTDTVNGVTAVASAGTGVDAPAITSEGLVFNAATQRLSLGDINLDGKTIEIDVESFDFKGSTDAHIRFLLTSSNTGPIIYHKSTGWSAFDLPASGGSSASWSTQGWWSTSADRKVKNHFNGKTVRLINHTDNTRELYLNNDLVSIMTDRRYDTSTQDLAIGGASTYTQSVGDQCYDMVISAIRIKDTEENE